MKKILSLAFISFTFITILFAQTNKIGGGTNYYTTVGLIGKTLPSLNATPAGNALVFVDYSHSDDGVVASLRDKNYIVTVASSWIDFNTKLLNGNFHLAVGLSQYSSAIGTGLSVPIVANFIEKGGSMIFTTWTASDNAIVDLFDASFTGNYNLSTVTITDPVVADGLTNPFSLTNPSWGIYSRGLNALTGGEVLATFENGNAAIVRGNHGHTILLGYLSDTPSVIANRDEIFTRVAFASNATVPIPYLWIILAFVLIATGVVFAKRKVIFS